MTGEEPGTVRLHAIVSGVVQGVGFRYWTQTEAVRLGLTGSAGNLPDGTVEVTAEGTPDAIGRLLSWLRSEAPPGRVTSVREEFLPATGFFAGFSAW
ncbi:acylphosphatase [Arthrobacter sp. NPDC090010]|uniref:acylphosphatase n=1 Tax=Arthrobacter sp. NPDC090010 TaxID=3363942 RepID=UPI0037F6B4D9